MKTLHGIGKPVRRKEDLRFITGKGRYTGDISLPHQLYLAVCRSPLAHANILGLDTTAAQAAEGVVAVITSGDLKRAGIGNIPCTQPMVNADGSAMYTPDHPILPTDRVVYAGEPVAAVIGESALLAKDAAELIAVEYEELPAVAEAADALAPGAPQIWDQCPGNLGCDWVFGDKAAVDEAFDRAAHIVAMDAIQNRLSPSSMEPRATLASYDAGRDEYTLYLASQNPHLIRYLTSHTTMTHIPETKLRVIAPDVGGGFGSKTPQYNEEYLCIYGARATGRPVKWVSDRSEAFLSDAHGRDHVTHAEMAVDADGKILAIRSSHVANLGAYAQIFGPVVPTVLYSTMLSGVYRIGAVYSEARIAYTNTVPTDAYRGAGRPEAAYTVERLVELAAEKLGIDSVEFRRRNFIPKDAFPYAVCTGHVYDSGDYDQCMDLALAAIDFDSFAKRRDTSRERDKLRGIGLSVYTELAGVGPTPPAVQGGSQVPFYEVTNVRVNPDASVTVLTGAHSHGQGHETSFAQVVAEKLNVSIENVEVVHGDTGKIPFGVGTFGSRSISLAGGALSIGLDKVVAKGKRIAAHVLEASADEIDFIDGYFKVRGSDRILSFADMVEIAYLPGNYPLEELEPGLEEMTYFDPPNYTFPAGCHICEVEIDPETGHTDIVNYCIGDDFGVVINPMIVEGQVHGGVAQGVGQALMEHAIYDPETAQLISGTFLDYCMPRAHDLPMMTVESIDNTTPSNPLGAKGCGEAGAIGAPVAVMNAVFDALKPAGVTQLTMPATPHKIWAAIEKAASRSPD